MHPSDVVSTEYIKVQGLVLRFGPRRFLLSFCSLHSPSWDGRTGLDITWLPYPDPLPSAWQLYLSPLTSLLPVSVSCTNIIAMEHSKHAPFRGAPTESHRKGRFEHMSDESPITDISKEGGQLHNMAFSDVSVSPTSTNLSQPVKPKTSLLSIPPELRLKIHGHVIIAAEPIKVYRSLKRYASLCPPH